MQVFKFAGCLTLSSLSIGVFLTSSGCSQLSGFGSLSDGTASTQDMRKEVASLLGAPEVASALIGAIAGILVPSPIKRKKTPA